jgi:hypothetical protein
MYSFVFRGLLTEEALDRVGRLTRKDNSTNLDGSLARRLPLKLLDDELLAKARRMATVYTVVAAFENTVRAFIAKRLLEEKGADWWSVAVSEKIRAKATTRQEEESKTRWHTPRGDQPLNYTEFGDLASIVSQNWDLFEDYFQSQEWFRQLMNTLERSRNVIMHSGELSLEDVERVGSAIRDYVRQVGA